MTQSKQIKNLLVSRKKKSNQFNLLMKDLKQLNKESSNTETDINSHFFIQMYRRIVPIKTLFVPFILIKRPDKKKKNQQKNLTLPAEITVISIYIYLTPHSSSGICTMDELNELGSGQISRFYSDWKRTRKTRQCDRRIGERTTFQYTLYAVEGFAEKG